MTLAQRIAENKAKLKSQTRENGYPVYMQRELTAEAQTIIDDLVALLREVRSECKHQMSDDIAGYSDIVETITNAIGG